MHSLNTIHEPARQTPICYECDLCVIGGSSTGVFAAVAAARLGLKVAIVEALGMFGGTATSSMVCLWHTHLDTEYKTQIFAGLTTETMDRLKRREAIIEHHSASVGWIFLPAELAIELDELITEAQVRPFLHARFVAPTTDTDGRVTTVIIEDKSGRRAIKAKQFIDASGDGDLVHRLQYETFRQDRLQPPTCCALLQGLAQLSDDQRLALSRLVFDPKYPEALPPGFLWTAKLPGDDMTMVAGTRVHGADCSDADDLTRAEIEGRRQVRSMMDLLRHHVPGGKRVRLQALPGRIGVRQSRQAVCLHRLTEHEVLAGQRFDDAIANGSYRVDVHSADGDGVVFRYLDGREMALDADGRQEQTRWRDPLPAGQSDPTFYQIPYRSLVPCGSNNILVAGRCLDADEGAFGAVRVMVNCSQLGEAAGTAAYLALDADTTVADVDAAKLRETLTRKGNIIL